MNTSTSKPTHQRPEHPDFWDSRFAGNVTPWDLGGVPANLHAFLCSERMADLLAQAEREGRALRVLIPGCGSAHEAAAFAQVGCQVIAVDFSAQAIAVAQQTLANAQARGEVSAEVVARVTLVNADFFSWQTDAPVDVVYERAFLCAIPRSLWDGYGQAVGRQLRPGGLLAGYYFTSEDENASLKGPPFICHVPRLQGLLADGFECLETAVPQDSLPVFAGGESWQVWQRR